MLIDFELFFRQPLLDGDFFLFQFMDILIIFYFS